MSQKVFFARPRFERASVMAALALLSLAAPARGVPVSALAARGYAVIPEPQRVALREHDFKCGPEWRVEVSKGVSPQDVAVESLKEDFQARFQVTLELAAPGKSRGKVIQLAIRPDSVEVGGATDRNQAALAEQAYRLELDSSRITITANAAPGLFYGVETLLQLVKPRESALWLPEGGIEDWPDLELREIYWDDAHHLERPGELQRAIRQAAFYKINAFSLKLEGHFQYKSAPAIVEPYALTPAELQELTDYALRYHVQLIPYLDGPAHIAFILKHPEYARLRAFPDSNYEACVTNPETYQLYSGMFDDLLAANKGVQYFHLSTDEPYYVGIAKNNSCNEADRAKELGSVGKLLAEFTTKTADYLHERGRTVIFWGEYPLKPDDIAALPSHLINGETYGPEFDAVFKAHGIRQMIYTSAEGEEPLFPNYYVLPSSQFVHRVPQLVARVRDMFDQISFIPARRQAELMGVIVAGWADAGLHPETFWLGYVTGTAAGWHPGSPQPAESMNTFYALFYGDEAREMGRIYQLLSTQAEAWEDLWDWAPSAARKPIWGNSNRIFNPPRPARDQTLPPLPVPSPDILRLDRNWEQENARRLKRAGELLAQNDELLDLLFANLERVRTNRYNLEVLISVARLCRQNLEMLLALGRVNAPLEAAQAAAGRGEARRAVASLDRALLLVEQVRARRNNVLHDVTATWSKSWLPRVAEANGRRYLDSVDDVKDHWPVRTVDMSYLIYRELLLPLDEWGDRVVAARNDYARAHGLAERNLRIDWKDAQTLTPPEVPAEEDSAE